MKSLKSRAHSLRLYRSDAQPEQEHLPGECIGISKCSVEIRFGIEFPVPRREHPARSAESADVRKEIEMIQCDLKRLHSSHRKPSHRPVNAIRNRPEGLVNIWNQSLRDIIF